MSAEANRLGLAIRRLREERELSIAALARASGMHPTSLGRIERGLQDPSLEKLYGLADGLDVPLSLIVDAGGAAT